MKNLNLFASVLMTFVLTLAAAAQTASATPANDSSFDLSADDFHNDSLPVEIATARCQYTSADAACAENIILAQYPRRAPGGPGMHGHRPMPRSHGYPGIWMGPPSGRSVGIGAAIGFGIGAAAGAGAARTQTAETRVATAFLVGGIGAFFGVVAASTPTFYAHFRHPRGPWMQDDEKDQEARRKNTKPKAPKSNPSDLREVAVLHR